MALQMIETTESLEDVWVNIRLGADEPIQHYYTRLNAIVSKLAQAQPVAIIKTAPEIKLAYMRGIAASGRLTAELEACKIQRSNLLQMHAYLKAMENVRGKQLKHLYSEHDRKDEKQASLQMAETTTNPEKKKELCVKAP